MSDVARRHFVRWELRVATLAAIGAALVVPTYGVAAHAAGTLLAFAGGSDSPTVCTAQSDNCSLTAALAENSTDGGGDTIDLETDGSSAHYVGHWTADKDATIQADGDEPVLDGNGTGGSILTVDSAAVVTVTGVTFTNGVANFGGAILNDGNLTVDASTFTGNHTTTTGCGCRGGAIANGEDGADSTLTVTDSTFSSNVAQDDGGAIDNGNNGTGTATVGDSTFTDNVATTFTGGAIDNGDDGGVGTLTVADSTFDSNSSGLLGGAIANGLTAGTGNVTVGDSTFTGNDSQHGGAIENDTGAVNVYASTFSADTSSDGPGILNSGGTGSHAHVAGNLFADACVNSTGGVWDDQGFNASIDSSCLGTNASTNGDLQPPSTDVGTDLGVLADNATTLHTQTLLPQSGNPAIDLIPSSTSVGIATLCPRTDQRGFNSPSAGCTAGAVEPDGTAPASGGSTPPVPAPWSPTITVVSSQNPGAPGVPVTFTATISPDPGCGSVTWLIDNGPPPTGTASGGSGGIYTLGPLTLAAGVHPVTAAFSGCSAFGPANGTVIQQVVTPSGVSTSPHVDPAITADVTSAHHRKHGWYRSAVTITFACAPGSAPLAASCPGPVVLTREGKNRHVSRTVSDTDGGSGSVTVTINIDRTGPDLRVRGVTDGKTYSEPPTPTCVARDDLSGVASCELSQRHTRRHGVTIYRYTATATDLAGNATTEKGVYRVS